VYAGVMLAPNVQLTAGRLRERQLSSARRSRTTYGLLTATWNLPGWRLVGYAKAKLAKDDIPDDRLLWSDAVNAMVPFGDPLVMQDTFAATGYVEGTFSMIDPLEISGKAKYEKYHQFGDQADDSGHRHRQFFGLINRAAYRISVGERLEIRPQWKSMFKREIPTLRTALDTRELTESFFLTGEYRVLPAVRLDFGVERTYFANLRERPANPSPEYAEEYQSWATGFVLTNRSDYQGYTLTLTAGYQYERQDFEENEDHDETTLYLRLFAALGQ
jgi:hypothetical protein